MLLDAASALLPSAVAVVNAAQGSAVSLSGRFQATLAFEPLQQGIQAAWTDTITVARQFLDHAQPENGAFDRVVEHMEADQTGVEVAIGGIII